MQYGREGHHHYISPYNTKHIKDAFSAHSMYRGPTYGQERPNPWDDVPTGEYSPSWSS
jgi:hypothetical protein